MDDAAIVSVLQGLGDCDSDSRYVAPIEAATGCQLVLQRTPLDQLHHVVQISVFFAIAVKLDDVRVQQSLERFNLLLEALAKILVVGQVAG